MKLEEIENILTSSIKHIIQNEVYEYTPRYDVNRVPRNLVKQLIEIAKIAKSLIEIPEENFRKGRITCYQADRLAELRVALDELEKE